MTPRPHARALTRSSTNKIAASYVRTNIGTQRAELLWGTRHANADRSTEGSGVVLFGRLVRRVTRVHLSSTTSPCRRQTVLSLLTLRRHLDSGVRSVTGTVRANSSINSHSSDSPSGHVQDVTLMSTAQRSAKGWRGKHTGTLGALNLPAEGKADTVKDAMQRDTGIRGA